MAKDGLSRREFALGAAGAGAALLFPATSVAARARRKPIARGGSFAQGVAAGFPSTDGAVLWTRLDGFEAPHGRIRVEVARDPDFRRLVHSDQVEVRARRDHTAHVRLRSARQLEPGTQYFYRFESRDSHSRVGRFRTLRPPDSREPVRIAYFSCQRYEHGFFTPQAGVAEEDVDFVVSLGDYIYEEDAEPKLPEREDRSGLPNGHVERLSQFRSRYRTYRSDPSLRAMHARHAVVSIWDDCEVEGNWAGRGPSSGPSPVGDRAIPFARKRLNGMRAYFEWFPYDVTPHGTARIERRKIYRSMRLGRTAELFLLDTRKYRDPQPCEDGDFTDGPCFEDEQPRRRLGDAQKAWLKDGLVRSGADWKILANAQIMMALDIAPGQPAEHDSWNGYAAERREVLEHAVANGVRNLTSIVGDVHVFFAGDLYTDGRITGQRAGTEFVGASVTHDSLSLPGLDQASSDLVAERLPVANPHLKYANFGPHGYAVLEATAEALRVDFRVADTVLAPRAEVSTLASFEVASGDPRVRLTRGAETNRL